VNITEHVVITFWQPHVNIVVHEMRGKNLLTFLSAGRKYDLRCVKKLCVHIQVLGIVVMVKDERQGCNVSYCWQQLLLSSVEYVLLGSSKKITSRNH